MQRRLFGKEVNIFDAIKKHAQGDLNKHKNMKVGVIAGGIGIDLKEGKITHDVQEPTQKIVNELNEKTQGKGGIEFVDGMEELGIKPPPKQTFEFNKNKKKQVDQIEEDFIDTADFTIRDATEAIDDNSDSK